MYFYKVGLAVLFSGISENLKKIKLIDSVVISVSLKHTRTRGKYFLKSKSKRKKIVRKTMKIMGKYWQIREKQTRTNKIN